MADAENTIWFQTGDAEWVNLSRALLVRRSPYGSDLQVLWPIRRDWVTYPVGEPYDLDMLEQALSRMLPVERPAPDLAQEVADLHQIVRLLNERLAKLERG